MRGIYYMRRGGEGGKGETEASRVVLGFVRAGTRRTTAAGMGTRTGRGTGKHQCFNSFLGELLQLLGLQ